MSTPPQQAGPGYPQQYPQYPQWGPPPPQKQRNGWKIATFVLGGLFFVSCTANVVNSSGSDENADGKPKATRSADAEPKAGQSSDAKPQAAAPASKPAEDPKPKATETLPVTITAAKAPFKKTVFHDSDDYTSLKVTVTNNTDDKISVNPLYFEVKDADGVKYNTEVFGGETDLRAVELFKGEKANGTITVKGKIDAVKVYYRKDGFGTSYSAPVK
ncbi:DUF4352 domain-containing protein [Streptomyces sp. NPDC007325]|uniref:DUF4352 domain-containing protein n=1 Tax=Streptomyces sp. NPDC007325 TaxID=3154588 RepID=UPI0033DF5D1B